VVGGTRRLGCWQRHQPRRVKHVKMVIYNFWQTATFENPEKKNITGP